MKVAAVDIGTNSMRLLVVQRVGEGVVELGRYERVTGLGRGVDATGELSNDAMDRTLLALSEFGGRMREMGVEKRRAVATSASRDASNREVFFDRAELALGVRPEMISGDEEASLAFAGATSRTGEPAPHLVIDIGGGSTEFVTVDGGRSFDIGSVRLTDRALPDRPAPSDQLAAARALVASMFMPVTQFLGSVIGVAGTWTSLARIHDARLHHDVSDPAGDRVLRLSLGDVSGLVEALAGLTASQTAALPGLDPARAPVILAGAVIAEAGITATGAAAVAVSEHDLLDGVVADLLR